MGGIDTLPAVFANVPSTQTVQSCAEVARSAPPTVLDGHGIAAVSKPAGQYVPARHGTARVDGESGVQW